MNASLLKEFQDVQLQIEILTPEDKLKEQYEENELFENRYFKAMGFLKGYIESNTFQSSHDTSLSSTPQVDSLSHLLLPKMKIKVFTGELETWLEFKSTFTSVIHNSPLSNSHKFQLLRQYVDGYAKRIIDKIEFSGDYYQTAFDALCQRFDNKRLLVNKHIKTIFSLESINKESPKHLRQLLDIVSDSVTSIESLQITKECLSDLLLINIISDKLDKQSYREWKEFRTKEELPTLMEFFNFLKTKVDTLEEIQDQSSHNAHHNNNNNSNSNYKYTNREGHKRAVQVNLAQKKSCVLCKGNHYIYSCIQFLKLDTKGRLGKVNDLNLCHNCLRIGHRAQECTLKPCLKCHLKHNSLIHFDDIQHVSVDSDNNVQPYETSVNSIQNVNMPPMATHQLSAQAVDLQNKQVLLTIAEDDQLKHFWQLEEMQDSTPCS
uniref:Uncharacterized protein LOC114333451 n=1 Tax=Diabrotica virgifera virgifera TaxID=50390 RepID=A0A6P7FS53_DIAVI